VPQRSSPWRRRVRWLLAGVGFGLLAVAIAPSLNLPAPVGPLQPDAAVRGAVATQPPSDAATPLDSSTSGRAASGGIRLLTDAPGGSLGMVPDPSTLTGYVWPLANGRITLPYKAIPGGTRIKDGRLFHDGIDIASHCGDTVRAAHDGFVVAAGRRFDDWVGWVGDLGPYYRTLDTKKLWDDLPIVVVINDGNGYRSMYAHFGRITVAVGDRVRAGQRIGYEGMTGHASGCHVHYGLFSPAETATFGVRADLLKKLHLPTAEIARIDPLLVLPFGEEALRRRRTPPAEGWPAPTLPTSEAVAARMAVR
jgi:murein DD-endopeptidase MepM/ murein hydrolase activator NlpD